MEQKTKLPGFYKVDESLIINKDNEALAAYKKRKAKEYKIKKLESDITTIKKDMEEIKDLLRGLIK